MKGATMLGWQENKYSRPLTAAPRDCGTVSRYRKRYTSQRTKTIASEKSEIIRTENRRVVSRELCRKRIVCILIGRSDRVK
jgi:hypothetical protein